MDEKQSTSRNQRGKVTDLTGQTFSHLTVVGRAENKRAKNGASHVQWLCRCDCGQEILALGAMLRRGDKKSCGCVAHPRIKHGGFGTREYSSWQHMIARCTNQNNKKWHLYGGRGVLICEQWLESFPQFLKDVGPCPSSRHTLDRYPNQNGNYEPGNVRWATPQEQAKNTRRNVMLEYDGRVQCRLDWSRELNISESCIKKHLRRGLTLEEIVAVVSGNKRANRYGNSGVIQTATGATPGTE